MPKLNDTQSVLLASAAQRESGSIFPLQDTVSPGARVANAITKLLNSALVEERETSDSSAVHRTDGDLRFGLFVTKAGLDAIGIVTPDEESRAEAAVSQPTVSAKVPSKTDAVLTLLRREQGATTPELIEATGWLPHTTRAALTGLRKKGHTIERSKRGDVTCYAIASAADA